MFGKKNRGERSKTSGVMACDRFALQSDGSFRCTNASANEPSEEDPTVSSSEILFVAGVTFVIVVMLALTWRAALAARGHGRATSTTA